MGLSAVDQLLLFLFEGKSRVAAQMMAVGFSEYEMRDAWDQARAAGFTESTGLGQDRLTDVGRARTSALQYVAAVGPWAGPEADSPSDPVPAGSFYYSVG